MGTQTEEIVNTMQETINKLKMIEEELGKINVDTEGLEKLISNLSNVVSDMIRYSTGLHIANLTLWVNSDEDVVVYSWHSKTVLGMIKRDCLKNKTLPECVGQLLQDGIAIYKKLIEEFSGILGDVVFWLKVNKDNIIKINEIQEKLDELRSSLDP